MKETSENLISSHCLPFHLCKNNWYYLLVIIAGILYVTFFSFITEIGNLFVRFFDLRCSRSRRNVSSDDQSTDLVTSIDSENFRESSSAVPTKSDIEKYYFKGFIKIIFLFYQAKHLFPVDQEKYNSDSMFDTIQRKLSQIVNLNKNLLFPRDSSGWCPIPDILPAVKKGLKLSFILFFFILLLIIYYLILLVHRICCMPKYQQLPQNESVTTNSSQQGSQFHHNWTKRILYAGFQFILLGYATSTETLFSLLNCVSLDHYGEVLFIQGDIQCYQAWQYVIIGIVILSVIPFPFVITIASNFLEQKKISPRTFFASLILPLPYMVKWVWSFIRGKLKARAKQTMESWRGEESDNYNSLGYEKSMTKETNQDEKEMETAICVLTSIDEPFKNKSKNILNIFKLKWESILIGRCLVLIPF